MATARMSLLRAWGALVQVTGRLLPHSLFGRLALLLGVTAVASHVLALTLLFETSPAFRPPPPPPPPPLVLVPWAGPGPAGMPPPPGPAGMPPVGLVLDIGVRLGALLLAAWVGARWLAAPMRRLAQGAAELGQDVRRAPLPEEGTLECREATRVINQLQRNIQTQLAERDQFVAAVSHDLRTPLTRLALRVEYLDDAQQRQRFAKDIGEMNDMIHATLDYLRGAAPDEAWVRLDLAALVESLVSDFQEAGMAVVLAQGGPAAPPVRGQAAALRRCLGNLLENAVRYGEQASVSVTQQLGEVHVTVCDQGPGLPASEWAKVTQPFYRVEGSRNRSSGGVGLGLSIARDIALRHGGTLALRNATGGGLEAVLELPRPR